MTESCATAYAILDLVGKVPTPAVPGVPAFRRETVMAWLLDRVHARYDNESGYIAFIERMVDGIRAGEVEAAFEHGELDDILRRLR